jgi:hypothetical protein
MSPCPRLGLHTCHSTLSSSDNKIGSPAQIKAENPGIGFGDVAKIGSEKWKAADEDTKAKYEKMARDDKARYLEQKKEYEAKKAAEGVPMDTGGDMSDVGSE